MRIAGLSLIDSREMSCLISYEKSKIEFDMLQL